MNLELIQKLDLVQFKDELIEELKLLFNPGAFQKEKIDWITDAEAQKLLSISRTKLYQLRKEGELPYSTIGGRVYYRLEDINNLLNKNLSEVYD